MREMNEAEKHIASMYPDRDYHINEDGMFTYSPIIQMVEKSMRELGMKYDEGKLLMHLVTPEFTEDVAKVLTFGAEKYEEDSWQSVPDGKKRYTAAMLRHLSAYRKGEEIDSESGLTHLSHAACNLMFIMWFESN